MVGTWRKTRVCRGASLAIHAIYVLIDYLSPWAHFPNKKFLQKYLDFFRIWTCRWVTQCRVVIGVPQGDPTFLTGLLRLWLFLTDPRSTPAPINFLVFLLFHRFLLLLFGFSLYSLEYRWLTHSYTFYRYTCFSALFTRQLSALSCTVPSPGLWFRIFYSFHIICFDFSSINRKN